MKVKYITTLLAASILSVGLVVGCSKPCAGQDATTPSNETQVDPCAGANPCAGAETKEDPCAGANPCAGAESKENPCAGADPCAGKSE